MTEELSEKDATIKSQQETIEELKEWKRQAIELSKKWDELDKYVRSHPDATLGIYLSEIAISLIKDRDYWKNEAENGDAAKQNSELQKEVETLKSENIKAKELLKSQIK